jgi:hypothetical protein
VIQTWRRPKVGPKAEKKDTGMIPMMLKKMIHKAPSAKPVWKTWGPRMPMANEETTMFAESH